MRISDAVAPAKKAATADISAGQCHRGSVRLNEESLCLLVPTDLQRHSESRHIERRMNGNVENGVVGGSQLGRAGARYSDDEIRTDNLKLQIRQIYRRVQLRYRDIDATEVLGCLRYIERGRRGQL